MLHYNITKFIAITTMRIWSLTFLLLICSASQAHADKDFRVIASIKPVHSLVAGVMHGVGQPELLLASNQSPHHYSLKPSERRMLAKADVVFWIGPNMESFLPRLLSSLDDKTKIVTLMDSNNLTLHHVRQADHYHGASDSDQHTRMDAHIWLNTHNIEIMIDEITRQLASIDAVNASHYKNNSKMLHQRVKKLRDELASLLIDNQRPFLTYHDGYQYFEHEFKLENAGFVSSNEELPPSAKHIHALKDLIRQHSIQCVFYDAPIKPAILTSLLAGSDAKAVELDPTGIQLPADENNLFQTLRTMARKFQDCL